MSEIEVSDLPKYIVLKHDNKDDLQNTLNHWADTHYLKLMEVSDQYDYIAVMSRRTPDKYEGVTTMTEVRTMDEANTLLDNGWYILQSWKDKIRLGTRE